MADINVIRDIAAKNRRRAFEIVEKAGVIPAWKSVGATINLVGSLKTGLMVLNRDIDFHIYTGQLIISESFRAMAKLAENPHIIKVQYTNLTDTEEECIEWHAWYQASADEVWQVDMIHILKGSKYDGHVERVTDRINEIITPAQRDTILRLKYETAESKIPGIEYYIAVIRDGVNSFSGFQNWRKSYSSEESLNWMP